MTSFAYSTFTLPAALAAADPIIGDPVWRANPSNSEQVTWLESFRRRAVLAADMPEIRHNATLSAADHVAWLRAEGWDAQITGPTTSSSYNTDVYLASTLNIVALWEQVGSARCEGGVDRALIKAGAFTSSQQERYPAVEVVTQNPSFTFCFQQVTSKPTKTELAELALGIASREACNPVHLDFPMVDLCVKDEASYMLGLRSGSYTVTQAAEQLRLELNEVGGRASAAAEITITRSAGPRIIKIDGPFIVALSRNNEPSNSDKIVFAAYVDRDSWRKPAAGRI